MSSDSKIENFSELDCFVVGAVLPPLKNQFGFSQIIKVEASTLSLVLDIVTDFGNIVTGISALHWTSQGLLPLNFSRCEFEGVITQVAEIETIEERFERHIEKLLGVREVLKTEYLGDI